MGRNTQVTVYYPFHPLRGQQLEVYTQCIRGTEQAIIYAEGRRLLIPRWMLEPTAGLFKVEAQPRISAQALIRTADLMDVLSDNTDLSRLATADVCRSSHGSTRPLDKRTGACAGSNTRYNQTRSVAQSGATAFRGGRRVLARKRKQD